MDKRTHKVEIEVETLEPLVESQKGRFEQLIQNRLGEWCLRVKFMELNIKGNDD